MSNAKIKTMTEAVLEQVNMNKQLKDTDSLQNGVLLVMSTQNRSERCEALVS